MVDFQFEVLTTHLNDGGRLPERSAVNGAHAYLGAPYGVYQTADGYLAIAMTPSLKKLAELMDIRGLEKYYEDNNDLLNHRDEIKAIMSEPIKQRTTADWLAILQPADIWCSEVLDWPALMGTPAFQQLDFIQTIKRNQTVHLQSLRSPLRVNGGTLKSDRAAPALGEHTEEIARELSLDQG